MIFYVLGAALLLGGVFWAIGAMSRAQQPLYLSADWIRDHIRDSQE